jgi:hypothetical protein
MKNKDQTKKDEENQLEVKQRGGSFRLYVPENVQDLGGQLHRLRKLSDNYDSYLLEP